MVRLGTNRDAVINLAASLAQLKNLKELFLCHNELGDAGAKYFSDALYRNTSLIQLDLRGNNIGCRKVLRYLKTAATNKRKLSLLLD